MSQQYPLFESLRRDIYREPDLAVTIDPGDEMFRFTREREAGDWDRALVKYVHDGKRVAWPLLDLARAFFPDLSNVKLLDFASGYGRVTRHLIREIPASNVTVSDIIAEGVRFQERQFGVRGIVSVTDPADFSCDDTFDLIFVTSLFTHLPHSRFSAWLGRLIRLLSDRGALLFSVHDKSLHRGTAVESLVFQNKSESAILAGDEYGTTWVTEEYVRNAVAAIGPELRCTRLPRAVNNFHDLYVVSRQEPRGGLQYDFGPEGFIEEAVIQGDAFRCRGWIRSVVPWHSAESVDIWWGGERVAATSQLIERPDVVKYFNDPRSLKSGFDLNVPLSDGRSFVSPLLVRAVSSSGRFNLLHAGTLDGLLLRMLRNALIDPWDPFAAPESDVAAALSLRSKVAALEKQMAKLDRLGLGAVRRIKRALRW